MKKVYQAPVLVSEPVVLGVFGTYGKNPPKKKPHHPGHGPFKFW